jgi:outer membrane protein TolC
MTMIEACIRKVRQNTMMIINHPLRRRAVSTVLTVTALLGGCAIAPEPMAPDDFRRIAAADRVAMAANNAPIAASLSLAEAIARALKFNLEHRIRLSEQAYSLGQLELARYELLPQLGANVQLVSRDRDAINRAEDSVTGRPSLANPYITSDRTHTLSDLSLTWSVLDFGVSYYNAKQQADRVLIASERRRKSIHQLIQAVQTTYWRAMSAQKLRDEVRDSIAQAESALAKASVLGSERVRAPADALRYQRALLENLRTLESVEQELALARVELAGLINVAPGVAITLVEPDGPAGMPAMQTPLDKLEELAIANNADLREQHYNVRIAAAETRKALLKLFPGLSFKLGYQHDTNSFLVNDHWREAGLHVSWNLLNLLSARSQTELAEQGVRLAETKRMALQMSVVTQVNVAAAQFEGARRQYERADAIWKVDDRMLKLANASRDAQTESRLHQIASRTAAILSLLRRYQALSGLHAAAGRMQATLGLEPAIERPETMPLAELTRAIEASMTNWQKLPLAALLAPNEGMALWAPPVP